MFPWNVSAVRGMALIHRRDSYEKTLLKQNPGSDLKHFNDRVFQNGSTIVLRGVSRNDTGYYTFYTNPNHRNYCVVTLAVLPTEGKSAIQYIRNSKNLSSLFKLRNNVLKHHQIIT